jgi:tetratricopeptide (TPR) repeat protein
MATIRELIAAALRQHQAGHLQAAEPIYRQVLAIDPNEPDANHLLGVIANQMGQPDVAVEYIRRAIRRKGTDSAFYCNLSNALVAQGKLDEAISSYRRALTLNPRLAEAHSNLGNQAPA